MSRVCTVCTHPDRAEIDEAIATCRGSIRTIASRYRVTKDALLRHRDTHLRESVILAADRQREREDDSLLDRVDQLWRVCNGAMSEARAAGQLAVLPGLVGQAHRNIELRGQLTGELRDTAPATSVHVGIAFPIPDGARRPQRIVCEPAPPALPEPKD